MPQAILCKLLVYMVLCVRLKYKHFVVAEIVVTRCDHLLARPEQLFFSEEGMPGKILFSTFLGDFIEYEVELDNGQSLIVNEYTKDTAEVHEDGARVHLSFDPGRVSLYVAETGEVLSK